MDRLTARLGVWLRAGRGKACCARRTLPCLPLGADNDLGRFCCRLSGRHAQRTPAAAAPGALRVRRLAVVPASAGA